jgi:uncharacterized protein (DUF2147 family)
MAKLKPPGYNAVETGEAADKEASMFKRGLVIILVVTILAWAGSGRAATNVARGDLLGTWYDYQASATEVLQFNGDGTGKIDRTTSMTWSYSNSVINVYDPASNTNYTVTILSQSRHLMTVTWKVGTSTTLTTQVLYLDVSSAPANFTVTDLVRSFEYTKSDNTKVTYTFYADGYGLEKTGTSSSTSKSFTWTYNNPYLTLVGNSLQLQDLEAVVPEDNRGGQAETYEYEVVLYANTYLTLISADDKLLTLKAK